jgi:hypothetical protein
MLGGAWRFGESVEAQRQISIYLADVSNEPVTTAIPSGAQIRICKSGGALVNASGTWTNRGSGNYIYTAPQADAYTYSYLVLYIAYPGARRFVREIRIDTLRVGVEAARRHFPIYLTDQNGQPVPGLALSSAEIQVSIAGAAFANAQGTVTEVGDGLYDYEASENEIVQGPLTIRVTDAAAEPYVYTIDVFAASDDDSEHIEDVGDPLPAAIEHDDPEYVDFVESALNRLPYQFRDNP